MFRGWRQPAPFVLLILNTQYIAVQVRAQVVQLGKKMQLLVLLASKEESMYKVAERKQFTSFLQNKARFVKYNSSLLNQSGNTIIHEINALLTNAYTKTVDYN